MIISGGENNYPSEVESVLGAADAVKDVAVVGLPDEKWGERVHAVVVLHKGASASAAELGEWCRGKIAGYKRPRSISFVREEDIPRTATGKVRHAELRRRGRARTPRARLSGSERPVARLTAVPSSRLTFPIEADLATDGIRRVADDSLGPVVGLSQGRLRSEPPLSG